MLATAATACYGDSGRCYSGDGHGGPEAARYVRDHLFRNFQEVSAQTEAGVTEENITLRRARLRPSKVSALPYLKGQTRDLMVVFNARLALSRQCG